MPGGLGPGNHGGRLHNQTTYRASFGPSGTLTTQLLLQDEEFVYDRVRNPVEIRDWRIADEWPTGAKPVTRKMRYDDLYRLVRMGYEYEEGADTWTDPYAAEQEAASLPDNTRDRPMPRADFGAGHRVLEQSWQYDWLGNTEKTDDDQHAFWDRSLGTVGNGTPDEGAYRLKSANNTAAPGDHTGSLTTDYDEAGDLINLTVDRAGTCVGGNPCAVMHFAYDWDEVGRLVRARRWDAPNLQSIPPPESVAQATLEYVYDSSDQRTRKTAVDGAGHQLHSLYVFGSLELRHAAFDGTDYELTASTETPYLQAHGVRLARVVHQTPPDEYSTESSTRVFLELGDQLGSTSVVLDLASGELVERSTAYAYGAAESDYRPDRWGKFREDYRFTGKEEDIEVGLQYFGKRYYAPLLQRWISPDPLAVHGAFVDVEEEPDGDDENRNTRERLGKESSSRQVLKWSGWSASHHPQVFERGQTAGAPLELYAYAGNNPFTFIDPTGLAGIFIHQHGSSSFDLTHRAAQGSASYKVEWNNYWATEIEALESLKAAKRGDIVVYNGHAAGTVGGVTKALSLGVGYTERWRTLAGLSWGGDGLITAAELETALAHGSAPSVVVLSGCKSAGLLPAVMRGGVKLGIGLDQSVDSMTSQNAADRITADLVAGKTIREAVDSANKWLDAQPTNSYKAQFVMDSDPSVDIDKNLADNGLQ